MTIDLSDAALFAEGPPHDLFDRLRSEQPVQWVATDESVSRGGGFWSLTRHADIMRVARDNGNFSSHKGIDLPNAPGFAEMQQEMLIFMDPPEHSHLRKLLAKSFSPPVVDRFDGWIREVTKTVVDRVLEHAEFDFVTEVSRRLPALVLARAMGAPDDMSDQIVSWANLVFDQASAGDLEYFVTAGQIHEYVLALREQKRGRPAADMASELALAESRGRRLSDAEYLNYMQLLFTAGVETTQTLMSNLICMIVTDPEIEAAVESAASQGDARAETEEFLRMITPAMHFARTAKRDTEIGGQTIRAGDFVVMWYVAGNRDPAAFPDPHRFDPGRFRARDHVAGDRRTPPILSFGGAGGHFCMGSHLARLEGRALLEDLFSRGRRWRLAGPVRRGPSVFVNTVLNVPLGVA